jgi:hypothetical protein
MRAVCLLAWLPCCLYCHQTQPAAAAEAASSLSAPCTRSRKSLLPQQPSPAPPQQQQPQLRTWVRRPGPSL